MLQPPTESVLPLNLLHVIHVLLVLGEAKTGEQVDLAVLLIIQPKMLLAVFAVMASLQHA